ncbi:hypothetical protein [Paraburkholderia terrae]|uniref:hypothetical protein n=1 Tax=Paraburkholderia terrae TaxID=311230 RepID=UPI001EE2DC15|nr:hypothetical protein [Paraburkholderia terrae]GJH04555.1 hypothetical protein CBA19C8_28380 [Paraburkholderia terrae]
MANQLIEQRTPEDRSEESVDKAVEDSFPASDAPGYSGTTRIQKPADSDVAGTDPDEDVPDESTPGEPSPAEVPPDEAVPQKE